MPLVVCLTAIKKGGPVWYPGCYRNVLITTPGVNRLPDFDLKYFYEYNII